MSLGRQMITLHKYLYGRDQNVVGGADRQFTESLLLLSSGLLDSIGETVLKGEAYEELRAGISDLKTQLAGEFRPEAAEDIRDSARRILSKYAAMRLQNVASNAVEMQHVLGMLQQALMVLAGGNERSLSRLQQIQQSLQRTCQMQDMQALKACLADTMRFIRDESQREQERAAGERADLEAELGRVRESAGSSRAVLPGRPEGVRHVASELKLVPPQNALYMLAFRFERLQAIIQRYGPEAADELVFRLLRERVTPMAGSGISFRWTLSSLVAVFQRARNLVEVINEAAALNRQPLVCRMPLGNRTAVLTVNPSHLVAEGDPASPDTVIAEVDGFTSAEA